MLLPIRAGYSSRPCASFARLAKLKARDETGHLRCGTQWRVFATEGAVVEDDQIKNPSTLASMYCATYDIIDFRVTNNFKQRLQPPALMK
jgi:hypothetical protein